MTQEGGLDAKLTDLPTTNILILYLQLADQSTSFSGRLYCTVQYSTVQPFTESHFISGLLTTFVTLWAHDIVH